MLDWFKKLKEWASGSKQVNAPIKTAVQTQNTPTIKIAPTTLSKPTALKVNLSSQSPIKTTASTPTIKTPTISTTPTIKAASLSPQLKAVPSQDQLTRMPKVLTEEGQQKWLQQDNVIQNKLRPAKIEQGLQSGKSWEQIAKETNSNVDEVKSYSNKTRPNYGVDTSNLDRAGLTQPGAKTPSQLIKEYNDLTDTTKRRNYLKVIDNAVDDESNPEHDLAVAIRPYLSNNPLTGGEFIDRYIGGSNRAFYGSIANAIPKAVNTTRELAGNLLTLAPDGSSIDTAGKNTVKSAQSDQKAVETFLKQKFGLLPKTSDPQIVKDTAGSAGTLLTDLGLTVAVPGGAWIAATNHGAEESNRQSQGARDAGKSDTQALTTGLVSGTVQAAIEKAGIDKLMKPLGSATNPLTRALSGMLTEGLEEGSQQFASNVAEKTYNPNKNLTDDVVYSSILGAALGGPAAVATGGAETQDNVVKAQVTTVAPQNDYERAAAIDNGIITPETKTMSAEARAATAINSEKRLTTNNEDVSTETTPSVSTPETQFNADQTLNTADYQTLNRLYRAVQESIEVPAELQRDLQTDTTGRDAISTIVSTAPLGEAQWGAMNAIATALKQQGYGSMDSLGYKILDQDGQLIDPTSPEVNTQYRLEDQQPVNQTVLPSTDINQEYTRMFGNNQPTINLATELPNNALGATYDTPEGPSQIDIRTNQADPQATFFHEAVHKALNDYMTTDERVEIISDYAQNNLVDTQQMTQEQIEEKMSEDFIDYVASRKSTEFKRPTITERIASIFEKVLRRIQTAVLKSAEDGSLTSGYRQFYEDLYEGRFADRAVIDKQLRDGTTPEQLQVRDHVRQLEKQLDNPGLSRSQIRTIQEQLATMRQGISSVNTSSIYTRIDPQRALNTLQDFSDALRGNKQIVRLDSITPELAARIKAATGIDVSATAPIELTNRNAIHIANRHMNPAVDSNPLSDQDISVLPEVIKDPDSITRVKTVRGTQRIRMERNIAGNKKAVVEVIKKGDALNVVTYFNDSPSRRPDVAYRPQDVRSNRNESENLSETIANSDENVKYRAVQTDDEKNLEDEYIREQVAAHSSPDDYVKDLVDYIWSSEAKSQGVDFLSIDNGAEGDIKRKVSNNSPFYREYYAKYNSAPTKKAVTDMVRTYLGDPHAKAEYEDLLEKNHLIDPADKSVYAQLVEDQKAFDASIKAGENGAFDSLAGDSDETIRRLSKVVSKPLAKKLIALLPEVKHIDNTIRNVKKITTKDGRVVLKVNVRGKSNKAKIVVSTPETRRRSIRVTGVSNAQRVAVSTAKTRTKRVDVKGGSRSQIVDVSTPETRRKRIYVKGTRAKSTLHEFVAVTSEVDGKPVTELLPYNTDQHTLKNGTVVDKTGRPVGSYLGIDEEGNQYAYVEGKPININGILGDIESWGNMYHSSWDMNRLIDANSPNKETAEKVKKFTTVYKDQQEALMKTELVMRRKSLQAKENELYKNLPKKSLKKDLSTDLFNMVEKKVDVEELRQKYGNEYFEKYMQPAVVWSNKLYATLLDNTNASLVRNGFPEIPKRKNYITHIQQEPNLWEKFGIGIQELNPFGSSISSDVNPGRTRGSIPDEIVGKTEDTGARKRWNPFAQRRRGEQARHDFFAAIDAYFEPVLFNQYMTPAASRARVVEKAFRSYAKAKEMQFEQLAEVVGINEAKKLQATGKAKNANYKSGRRSPLVLAWQEYGNILAGKTNSLDRKVMELGTGGDVLMKTSTKAQGLVGASTIPGSTTAAVAQVLSIPQVIARDSGLSTLKAARDMLSFSNLRLGKNDPMRQSTFMRARYTDATSRRKSLGKKYVDAASVPMEVIEREATELGWRSAYHEALKRGYKGKEAVTQADIATKQTAAGRGIGDRPMIMNSKALGIFTQFGLEVNNMRLQVFNDFTPKQKVKFMVAAAVFNCLLGALTGQEQLPDYIGAAIDTYNDFNDAGDDSKDTAVDNARQAGQRLLAQTSKFVPGAPTITSTFMSDNDREQVFGKNSDVSRYGTPAISRIISGVPDLVKGDWQKGLADTASAVVPTGSQIKRTSEGLDAVNKGYVENSSGKVQNTVDKSNLLNWAQGALFGKSSLPGQKAAADSGLTLSEKQSAVFKKLLETDATKAVEYFNNVMNEKRGKARKGTITDTGRGDTAGALSLSAQVNAEVEIGKAEGTYTEKNGIIYNKSGAIARSVYKDSLKDAGDDQGDNTYNTYLLAYGLDSTTSATTQTGDKTLDSLLSYKSKSSASDSVATNAINLYKGADKYADVPDWVRNRYYSEAGYTEKQVQYGALASVDATTKLEAYYRPLARESDNGTLYAKLYEDRKKSIYKGYVAAQDSIITSLYKEGYLTYEQSKTLKAVKLSDDGSVAEKQTTSSSKKSSGSGSKSSFTADTISDYLKASNSYDSELLNLLSKNAGVRFTTSSVKSRTPTMRKITARKSKVKTAGKGKLSLTALG